MKEKIISILGKYKVVGDTTFGLGYEEANKLAEEIINTLIDLIRVELPNGWIADIKEDLPIVKAANKVLQLVYEKLDEFKLKS